MPRPLQCLRFTQRTIWRTG